jgi:hypothetical protein
MEWVGQLIVWFGWSTLKQAKPSIIHSSWSSHVILISAVSLSHVHLSMQRKCVISCSALFHFILFIYVYLVVVSLLFIAVWFNVKQIQVRIHCLSLGEINSQLDVSKGGAPTSPSNVLCLVVGKHWNWKKNSFVIFSETAEMYTEGMVQALIWMLL